MRISDGVVETIEGWTNVGRESHHEGIVEKGMLFSEQALEQACAIGCEVDYFARDAGKISSKRAPRSGHSAS